jgi:hypothetical protein
MRKLKAPPNNRFPHAHMHGFIHRTCLGVLGVLGAGHDEIALLLQLAHELESDALVGAVCVRACVCVWCEG